LDPVFVSLHLKNRIFLLLIASLTVVCWHHPRSLRAQPATFDDFFQVQTQPNFTTIPNRNQFVSPPPVQAAPPPTILPPPEIIFHGNPGNFSPVSPQGTMINVPPGFDPFQGQPASTIPNQNTPFPIFPYANPSQPFGSGVQPVQPGPWGGGQTFQQPTYQGTSSNWLPSTDWNQFSQEFLPRVFERPRARQTYLAGSGKDQRLGMHDIELATTLTWANFLQSNQPLRTSPGFIFHFWDGPSSVANPGFDLPPRAYSIFLSFDHLTNPANQVGLETNFTIGYYSDFNNTSSNGFRYTGRGLFWTRLNEYTVGKIGVEYFDRVSVKMLPAFGVYMTPNPDTKIDLLFPQSKLSHRIPNLNDYEAWVYVGGEYGGGSWVIDRMGGGGDQVDINDVRAFLGIEWMGPRRVTGFFEGGYVFNREILYRSNPTDALDLRDTFMIRSGFAF